MESLARYLNLVNGARVINKRPSGADNEGAPRHLFMEFFGTCMITFVTTGSVLSTGALSVKYDLEELRPGRIFGIAFANAAVYVALLVSLSGLKRVALENKNKVQVQLSKFTVGHFNPATSMACYVSTQIELKTALKYSVAQLLGAITGSLIMWMTWFAVSPVPTMLGANIPHADSRWWEGLFVEITMSFAFHWVLLTLLARGDKDVQPKKFLDPDIQMNDTYSAGPYVSGVFLLVGNAICIAVSGGSMNPARSFGPAVVAGVWSGHWMYWIGPYLGAMFAAHAYIYIPKIDADEEKEL